MYGTPKDEVEKALASVTQEEPPKARKADAPVIQAVKSPKEETAEKEAPIANTVPTPPLKPVSDNDIAEAGEKYKKAVEEQEKQREHVYLQQLVKKLAEQRGFKAVIEEALQDGGRVDLSLSKEGLLIACEISVTNTAAYEARNIQKCFRAGYGFVFVISSSETHLQAIRSIALNEMPESDMVHTRFLQPEMLGQMLDSFLPKEDVPEQRIKGYRVNVRYGTTSQPNETGKTIAETIVKNSRNRNLPKT